MNIFEKYGLKFIIIVFFSLFFNKSLVYSTENLIDGNNFFIENKGQVTGINGKSCDDILFYTGEHNSKLFFRKTGISYVFPEYSNLTDIKDFSKEDCQIERIDLSFEGCNSDAKVISGDTLSQKINFYKGSSERFENLIASQKIIYKNIYENIDLVFYHSQRKNKLKYDFILHPGANPDTIKMTYSSSAQLELLDDNSLQIKTYNGIIREESPYAYQIHENEYTKEEISCGYSIKDHSISFEIGDYNKSNKLVIDPNLLWSTYYGGSNGEHAQSLKIDSRNNTVVTGRTLSIDFPVSPGAHQQKRNGFFDAFIIKLDNSGNLLWATYFGGEETDYAQDLDFDEYDNIYLTGFTWSRNFPVTDDAMDKTFNGPINEGTDGFIAKFNSVGQLIWSTYYGGEKEEHFYGIAVKNGVELAITGWTKSKNIITSDSGFDKDQYGNADGFLARMTLDGRYIWGTYFGGDSTDEARTAAYDKNGDIVFGGFTNSKNFPVNVTGEDDREEPEGYDAFIARFDAPPNKSSYLDSKLFGGIAADRCYSLAVDSNNDIVFTGETYSADYHSAGGVFQSMKNGKSDVIITKINSSSQIIWSGFYGGKENDAARAIAVDNSDNILAAGHTYSDDLALTYGAFKDEFTGVSSTGDAFILKAAPDASEIKWASYIGGRYDDNAYGVDTDPGDHVLVCGVTGSDDFHVTDAAHQKDFEGTADAFVLKICRFEHVPDVGIVGDVPFCPGDSVVLLAADGFEEYTWSTGETTQKIKVKKEGIYYVTVVDDLGCTGTSKPIEIELFDSPEPEITGDLEVCEGDSSELSVEGDYEKYEWGHGETDSKITVSESGEYLVTVTDSNGCTGRDSVEFTVHPNPAPLIHGPESVCAFSENVIYWINSYPNHTYTWTVSGSTTYSPKMDDTNIEVKWAGSGTGKITIIDTNKTTGCVGCDTMYVNIADELLPEITSNTGKMEFCEGDSLILNAGNGYDSYKWSTGETSRQIVVKSSGTYSVLVKDKYDCEGRDTAIVTKHPLPHPKIRGAGELCFSDNDYSYETAETADHSYTWSVSGGDIKEGQGAANIIVNWTSSGSKTITVFERNDITGCENVSEEFIVTVHPLPEPDITVNGPIEFCEGDTTELIADAGFESYEWSDGSTSRMIEVTKSGDYSVEVTDANGCTGESNTFITVTVHPNPPKPQITKVMDSLYSTPAEDYQWYKDGTPIPGAADRKYVPDTTGSYSVRIYDKNGCTAVSDEFEFWKGIASAEFSVPDTIFAAAGEEITVPITLASSKNLTKVEADSFTVYLRYNKTVLLPFGNFTCHTHGDRENVITISGVREDTIGLLADFNFRTAWGDAACSPIIIDSVVWNAPDIFNTVDTTIFCLTDLCYAGGERLFFESGKQYLLQNRPNPFSNETEIIFSTIQHGKTELYLIDIMGKKVKTLFEEDVQPGLYRVNFAPDNLPAGIYIYVLRTPTNKIFRKMEIVK